MDFKTFDRDWLIEHNCRKKMDFKTFDRDWLIKLLKTTAERKWILKHLLMTIWSNAIAKFNQNLFINRVTFAISTYDRKQLPQEIKLKNYSALKFAKVKKKSDLEFSASTSLVKKGLRMMYFDTHT